VDFDDSAILQTVEGVRLVSTDGEIHEVQVPGLVLDRTRFDKMLAIHALEAGADLACAMVLRRVGSRVVIRRDGLEADFEGAYILGADGPSSVVCRSIGSEDRVFHAALQYEVGLQVPEPWVEYFHYAESRRLCAWFVPSGRTARLGVRVRQGDARFLRAELDDFLRPFVSSGRVFGDGILGCTGGLVPANGARASKGEEGVLLAGDAGGLAGCFGNGIASAVVSGELAGAAVESAIADSGTGLSSYDADLKRLLPAWPGVGDGFAGLIDQMEAAAAWCGV